MTTFKQFLKEVDNATDKALTKHMQQRGYDRLGSGLDKIAYIHKHTNDVILVVAGETAKTGFTEWVKYCRAHKSNPYLPNIIDYAPFELGEREFLQVKSERLFPIQDTVLGVIGHELEYIVQWIESPPIRCKSKSDIIDFVKTQIDNRLKQKDYPDINMDLLIMHLDDIELFIETIIDINEYINTKLFGASLDLHEFNFMFGEDGTIVINDPWVM